MIVKLFPNISLSSCNVQECLLKAESEEDTAFEMHLLQVRLITPCVLTVNVAN